MSVLQQLSTILRKMDVLQASNMEDIALRVVQHFRNNFVDKETGESAFPLVCFYVTQRGKDWNRRCKTLHWLRATIRLPNTT